MNPVLVELWKMSETTFSRKLRAMLKTLLASEDGYNFKQIGVCN